MSNLHLTRAKHLLKQARTLRSQVQQDIRARSFPDDDLHMRTYNDLIMTASELFFDDPILNGQMVKMPDAVVQMYSPEYGGWLPLGTMPPELPSQRTEEHLTRLINRLEILLGEEPTQQSLDERDFSFVADQDLREVLRLDFIEAQKSFAVGAHKACGLLCGGLIEGMLLDIVQRRGDQSIEQDRVGMTALIKMSGESGLVSNPVLKFAEGARDIRDTVHPRAEVRQRHRVLRDEAEILLQLVKLIYNDLVAGFSKGEKND